MRQVVETTSDVRRIAEELSSILESDLSLTEKAKHFENAIKESTYDVKAVLELFDLPDLQRHEEVWPAEVVEAAREHAKECDVCKGDVLDQPDEFAEQAKECLTKLQKIKDLEFPDSSDRIVANYSKGSEAFSVVVEVRVSGVEVICHHKDLQEIIEAKIAKISTVQTSRNFLFCTVGALPRKYKDYELVV